MVLEECFSIERTAIHLSPKQPKPGRKEEITAFYSGDYRTLVNAIRDGGSARSL